MASIGDWIKKCRLERKWSQTDLASQMGVATPSIGNWEKGKNLPQELNLKNLEHLFGERRPLSNDDTDMNKLLAVLRDHFKGKAPNIRLREKLNWPDSYYWTIRARALDEGRIILGRGQGGSVKIVEEDEFEHDLERFRRTLHDLDGKAGNSVLRKELKWDEERYWGVEQHALDKGLITRGRGRGGTAILVREMRKKAKVDQSISGKPSKESKSYEPIRQLLDKYWGKIEFKEPSDFVVEITALTLRGKEGTGGTWTQPDVAILAVRQSELSNANHLEVITFEIKTGNSISVTGVFEALSHREFAHRSFVVYHCKEAEFSEGNDRENGRILELAQRHGVGVIVADNAKSCEDVERLNVRVRAEYRNPRPEMWEDFISKGFRNRDEEIRGWFTNQDDS